jgi:PhnB protein
MMEVEVHLTFCGQCEEAFRFYERTLGAKIGLMLSYGNSPAADGVAAEWRDKIVHANLTLGDIVLAGADVRPEDYEKPGGFCLLLGVESPAQAEQVFRALAEDGVVRMPLQKTFWSPAFGVVVDRFGTPWEVSCRQAP